MTAPIFYEDGRRMAEIMAGPVSTTGVMIYDPQCDEPLEELMEIQIEQATPPVYLNWILREYNGDVQPAPTSEYECHRAIRKFVRGLPEYAGKRFIQ